MQPGDPVIVDVEVLADQLAQQSMCRLNGLLAEQLRRPFYGPQRALGVLSHPGQHALANTSEPLMRP